MATGRTLLNNALEEPGFKQKLAEVCNKLQCKPEDLLKVMANESGIKPDALNRNGGASGLIQFMPFVYESYGLTGPQLRSMTRVQQLDYVYKFFKPHIGKLTSPGAIYALTYLPGRFQRPLTPDQVSIPPGGKPFPTHSPVLASKYDTTTRKGRNGNRIPNTDYYTANAGLDVDGDGYTTVADLTAVTNKKTVEFGIVDGILNGVTPSNTVQQTTPSPVNVTSSPAALPTPTPPPVNYVPAPPPPPEQTFDDYIQKVYKTPFLTPPEVSREIIHPIVKGGPQTPASQYYAKFLSQLQKVNYGRNDIDYLAALNTSDLNNDFLLIDNLIQKQQVQAEEVKNLLDNKLGSFSPDAKLKLIQSALFEMFPDDMRRKMSLNSRSGSNPNYSHAWRSPGKVAITADITIPGIAGLRVGQIFWVDKVSDAYKEYGAFQLFSLTENIDMSKGWTTSIHSRFNVLPRRGSGRYLTDEVSSGATAQEAREAKPVTG